MTKTYQVLGPARTASEDLGPGSFCFSFFQTQRASLTEKSTPSKQGKQHIYVAPSLWHLYFYVSKLICFARITNTVLELFDFCDHAVIDKKVI